MQAVILAGGLGTRLRPLTEKIPKVMTEVKGKPFLWYVLQLLKRGLIQNVVLCVGYRGDQIRDFFGNGEDLGISIGYSEERGELLGTGGALKQAQSLLEDHFFVINGDTYIPLEYSDVHKSFIKQARKALMVVYRDDVGGKNNVQLDDRLMVIKHDKGGLNPNLKYVDAGVLVVKREALALIPGGRSISLEEGLYQSLMQQHELAAYVTANRFYDIGTLEGLKIFENFLGSGMR